MTKLIRSLTLSVIIVLVLTSCIPSTPAKLELTIQANTSVPYSAVGQVIKYSYAIKNISAGSLPGTATVTSDKTTVTCPGFNTIGNLDNSLDVNETIVCTADYPIKQADLDTGSVTNIATANVNGIFSNQATFTALTGSKTIVTSATLTLTTTANPSTYDQVGQQITLTYVIKNSGTVNLGPAQFTVSDSLISTAPFNCGAANTTLAPNATVTCSATYTITQADVTAVSITNIASASGGGAGPSPTASATINKAAKVLTLTTTANPLNYGQVGQVITFTYVIKNNGAVSVGPAQFTVSDSLIGAAPINCGAANTTLAPNETVTCSATYTITQADMSAVSITNIASALGGGAGSSQSASTTVNKSNNPFSLGSTIQHKVVAGEWLWQIARCYGADLNKVIQANPQLSNTASIPPDTTVTVPNIGSVGTIYGPPCNSVPNLVAGSTIKHQVVAGEWLWQIARCYGADPKMVVQANSQLSNPSQISPDTTVTVPNIGSAGTIYGPPCVVIYTVQSGDTWNTIAQQFNADLTILQKVNSGVLSKQLIVPRNSAGGTPIVSTGLTLTKTANPTIYSQVNQLITFTYVIKNSGTANLGPAQFTVSDSLISATPINCGAANTTLAPNATVTCSATYTITQNDLTAVSITNIATASGGGVGPSPSASATVNKNITALSLTTVANPLTYNQVGQQITFTYVIKNSGTVNLGPAQFTVSDSLISSAPFNCGIANTSLAPNALVTCSASYAITQADLSAVSITNIATASGGGAGPSQPASTTIIKQ